ncbi:MAG: ATP-binding protein [Candidatus Symbiothrix sp.]|jgi:hypothetical protein|nr:ATP-binding protein [Candidatus Symbiothrix sp.]
MKKLPIGIQSFEKLRSGDFLYVDKTENIYNMVTNGKIYFLSRPRRFGKSLLISTMEELFKGNKKLFEGLFIYDRWNWEEQYPVVRIDWTQIKHGTPEEMERSMVPFLKRMATGYGIQLFSEYASDCFGELIQTLYANTGKQVVVLIDEYDVPILDSIGKNIEEINKIREFLKDFYRMLKATDYCLKFTFLTGVSKFSRVSIFSVLNSPNDITLDERYATVCGYTQEELEYYFSNRILDTANYQNLTREELLKFIKDWYDGYSWDGKSAVYNPYSTLYFFDKHTFDNYWFSSGTPSFLVELIKKRNDLSPVLSPVTMTSTAYNSWDPDSIGAVPLLFQTGYLTVKKMELDYERVPLYTLASPNKEVNISMQEHLMVAYTSSPIDQVNNLRKAMQQQIMQNDAKGLENSFKKLLAYVPYQLDGKSEAYYHSIFLIAMSLLGFDVQGEIATNHGRIDAVWEQSGQVVIAELKYGAGKKAETLLSEALTQIHDRRYYERYIDRELKLLGIAFTGVEVACRIEADAKAFSAG